MTATALALVATFATADTAGATPVAVPEVQLVVKLSGGAAVHASSLLAGLPGSTPRGMIADRYSFQVPEGEVAATLSRLQSAPGVEYASQVRTVHSTALPNDPCYVSSCVATSADTGLPVLVTQSDLNQVNAPGAWAVTTGANAPLVAVLDTGVDGNHPDLIGKVIVGPVICAQDDPTCAGISGPNTDDNGHGTHVTGTIAAATNNGSGVASLGWQTRAETFKVLDSTGSGTTADLATGIYDAVAAGARVINMSLGNDACSVLPQNCGPDPDTQAAVQFALAHNVVVVAAAGNDSSTEATYPAGYPGVLSVASVDGSDNTSTFSEYGAAANISAPGEGIVSTWNNGGYDTLTGTSMSAPHVAAAAALVFAANPALTAAQVTSILRETASPEGGRGIDGGVLNAGHAVQLARSAGPYGGYDIAGADGSVYAFGASPYLGGLTGQALNKPVVAVAGKRDHTGYWMAASDGGIFDFGSAAFYGSTGNVHLNKPIVGMAATPDGGGYWLVASDGGIFDFGDAAFYGSTGNMTLNRPIVGIESTSDGGGYWLVASDGGVFAFGDAPFEGSAAASSVPAPVIGIS